MNYIRLYLKFMKVYIKTALEYRFSFVMDMLSFLLSFIISLLGVWIVLGQFNFIQGWGFYEIMFLTSIELLSYGLGALIFWSPMYMLEGMVQQGTFDSILIKPMHPLLHMVLKNFNHAFLMNLAFGAVILTISSREIGVVWSYKKILWLIAVVLGGALIHSAILILSGSVSFWTVKSNAVFNSVIYSLKQFTTYPIHIYPRWIQLLLTFVVPYAFASFYPASYFLNKGGVGLFHPAFQYGTPAVGIFLFLVAYTVWKVGINRYQGTGS